MYKYILFGLGLILLLVIIFLVYKNFILPQTKTNKGSVLIKIEKTNSSGWTKEVITESQNKSLKQGEKITFEIFGKNNVYRLESFNQNSATLRAVSIQASNLPDKFQKIELPLGNEFKYSPMIVSDAKQSYSLTLVQVNP